MVLARELLNNAVNHSGAAHVEITVAADAEWVELAVGDDGRGFDPSRRAASLLDGHIGLASSKQRALSAGGTLTVSSAPGRGTTVRVTLRSLPAPQSVRP